MSPLAPGAEPAPAAKPRRNLLFSSSSRKERERAQARTDRAIHDRSSSRTSGCLRRFPSQPRRRPHRSTTPGRSRSARGTDAPPRRGRRTPSTFAETGPAAAGADLTRRRRETRSRPQVTVLKSGVVDGMAYSLYSDGSIEAQMPEGMMRFASIDELRSHLDQRP